MCIVQASSSTIWMSSSTLFTSSNTGLVTTRWTIRTVASCNTTAQLLSYKDITIISQLPFKNRLM